MVEKQENDKGKLEKNHLEHLNKFNTLLTILPIDGYLFW